MKQAIVVCIIMLLAIFLRFYRLDTVPPGLGQDETSLGYNAYSILKTGKDEHGIPFPQNFKAFGEYKLPGYIYLSVIPIAFLGPTPLAVRLPSALAGVLTVLLVYFLTIELLRSSKNNDIIIKHIPLVATFLLAVNPWHLHLSRAAFEVTVSLFFSALAIYVWLIAKRKSSLPFFIFSVICFALSAYTYTIARLLAPVCFLYLLMTSKTFFPSGRPTRLIILGSATAISFGPMLFGMMTQGGASAVSGTMIWSSAAIQAPLLEWRSYFSSWPIQLTQVLFNKPLLTGIQFVQNFINFFSPSFFFTTGPLHGNHGIGTTGLFYLFETATILFGIIYMVKKKIQPFIWFWIVTTICVVSLTRESPQATRAFFIVIPVTILSAIGLVSIFHSISLWKSSFVRSGTYIIIFGFIAYQLFSYVASYYIRFPIFYAKPWRTADKEVSLYIKDHESEYDKIIIDTQSGFVYTSLLYYNKYSPSQFQKTAVWSKNDSEGFSFPITFGKYEFRSIDLRHDLVNPRTLIVTTKGNGQYPVTPFLEFNYPERPVVIPIGQTIAQYPTTENAYILLKK